MIIQLQLKDIVQSDDACKVLGFNPYCVREGADGDEWIIVNSIDAVKWNLIKGEIE